MANNLRIGGLSSGLDTEAMVKAMSASTMLKLNNNRRKVKKLEAQQTAYRDIISKLQGFKNKYFDVLNRSTFLKSTALFNQNKATTTVGGEVKTPNGVTVSAGSNAIPGTYNVTLLNNATQAKRTASTFAPDNGGFTIKSDAEEGVAAGTLLSEQTYGFTIKVGSTTKNIVFTAQNTKDGNISEINDKLRDAFGDDNTPGGKGLVYIDTDGSFKATDRRDITFTDAIKLDTGAVLSGLEAIKTGANTFTVRVGGEVKAIDVSTLGADFFDILFDGSGLVSDANKSTHINTVAEQRYYNMLNKSFGEFATASTAERDKLYQSAFDIAKKNGTYVVGTNGADNVNDFKTWLAGSGTTITVPAEFTGREAEYRAFKIVNDNTKALSPQGFIDSTTAEYDSRKSIFDQAVMQQYNEYVRPAYDSWVSGSEYASEKDDLFDNYYNYRLADQKDKYWTTFYNANKNNYKDGSGNLLYADADAMKAAYGSGTALDSAFDTAFALVSLDKTKFKNGGYSEFEAFKWALSADNTSGFNVTTTAQSLTAYTNSVTGRTYNEYTVDWTSFSSTADINISVGGVNKTLFYSDYSGFNSLSDLQTWLSDNGLSNLVSVSQNGNDFTFKAKNSLDNLTITGTGVPAPSTTPFGADEAAEIYNQNAIKNAFENVSWADGKKINVTFDANGDAKLAVFDKDGHSIGSTDDGKIAVSLIEASNSANKAADFGIDPAQRGQVSAVSSTMTLADIAGNNAIKFDANGIAKITINGTDISLKSTMTITEMLNAVTSSKAGVTMTFSSLTNKFELTAKEYGTGGKVDINDNGTGLLARLGFSTTAAYDKGQNLTVEINGQEVQSASNSVTVDGVTFSFTSAAVGRDDTVPPSTNPTTFTTTVSKDPSTTVSAIKSFVEDYNKLIFDVYAMLTEKPNKDYYFLTDNDIEDLKLSDRQVEQWEQASKLGLLYNDSTVSGVMEKLRSVMYSPTTGLNGEKFSIFNIRGYDGTIAIKTTSDYKMNGMLEFDEKALTEALETNPDDIMNFFTNSSDGLMKRLEDVLNYAVKSTGSDKDMGVLIQKAGLATGLSAIKNSIFDEIKSLNDTISKLQTRYDKQQDRYWKQFTNMEKQFSVLNSQSDYIANMFGSLNSGNK